MKTIFIVDDNDTNLIMATSALDNNYKTFAMPSAEKMFSLLRRITPDLILLDVDMPDMDGFEAIKILKEDEIFKSIPVIFLTASNDAESEISGFELGALDFITKPFSPPVLLKRIQSHIETDMIIKINRQAVRDMHNATISVIADLVENRDQVTGGHIERTQGYLAILIDKLLSDGIYTNELKHWDMSLLLPSAQLHDVGKINISDLILNKPGILTKEEFELIKTHCIKGELIIDQIISKTKDDGFLLHAKKFAGSHHEKWDGSGYPRGLKKEEIPLEGRIMAIPDVYDALVSERPYKIPFSHDEAVEIICKDSGKQFDPKILNVFKNVADDFKQKWEENMNYN